LNRENLPKIYETLEMLLDSGLAEKVSEGCLKVSEAHPDQAKCWLIQSRALQAMGLPDAALEAIRTAIHLEPLNMDHTFQIFNVYIQLNRPDAIAKRINRLWPEYDSNAKMLLAGYLKTAMATGLVVKYELSVEVASFLVLND
jgi:hypothetical protein